MILMSSLTCRSIINTDRKQLKITVSLLSRVSLKSLVIFSAVVLEESPCPRGPIYKSLSLDYKVLEIVKDSAFYKQSIMYHVKSINSVTSTVNEVTVKDGLLTVGHNKASNTDLEVCSVVIVACL